MIQAVPCRPSSGGTAVPSPRCIMQLPPLHPILVNFTAALVPASFVSDVLGRFLRRASLTASAWWMLLYATLITPFTAATGLYWMRSMDVLQHGPMSIHKWLGIGMVFMLIVLTNWRWRFHRRATSPGWPYLIVAAVIVGALTIQGHLGGSMTFASDSTEPATLHMPEDHSAGHGASSQWHDHISVKD